MNKLSREKKNQLVLVAMATTMVCSGIYFGVVAGQNERLKTIEGRLTQEGEKVAKAERALRNRAALDEELALRTEELHQVEATMASGDLYAWIIGTMNRRAASHNVTIPTYGRETVGEIGLLPKFPYKTATFLLRGTGRFEDFGRFVAGIENDLPFARLQNLDLSPAAGAGDDAGRIDFRFDIVVPIRPNLPAIAQNENAAATSR